MKKLFLNALTLVKEAQYLFACGKNAPWHFLSGTTIHSGSVSQFSGGLGF
jgi:hypothetical protein